MRAMSYVAPIHTSLKVLKMLFFLCFGCEMSSLNDISVESS